VARKRIAALVTAPSTRRVVWVSTMASGAFRFRGCQGMAKTMATWWLLQHCCGARGKIAAVKCLATSAQRVSSKYDCDAKYEVVRELMLTM